MLVICLFVLFFNACLVCSICMFVCIFVYTFYLIVCFLFVLFLRFNFLLFIFQYVFLFFICKICDTNLKFHKLKTYSHCTSICMPSNQRRTSENFKFAHPTFGL